MLSHSLLTLLFKYLHILSEIMVFYLNHSEVENYFLENFLESLRIFLTIYDFKSEIFFKYCDAKFISNEKIKNQFQ